MKKPSPFVARAVMAVACLLGLFASAYLLYTYVSGAPIACGSAGGCEMVRLSKWAWTFGIPRPLLGIVFYVGLFALLVVRAATDWQARWLYRLTMIAALFGFIESAFLFLIQWLDIKAFCLWCLASGVAATVILCMAPFDRLLEQSTAPTNKELKTYFILLLTFIPLAFVGFIYLLRLTSLIG